MTQKTKRCEQSSPRIPSVTAIAIFGEVLLDIFPQRQVVGGAPFNVAWHLHALGVPVAFFSALGRDALAAVIQEKMQTSDFPQDHLHFNSLPTGQVQVHPDADGGHTFEILAPAAFDAIPMPTVAAPLAYYGSLVQRSEKSRQALLSWLPSVEKRFFDLNLRAPWDAVKSFRESLHLADIVKCNAEEWQRLQAAFLPDVLFTAAHTADQDKQLAESHERNESHEKNEKNESNKEFAALCQYFNWDGVLVTQGVDGATFYEAASGCLWQVPSMPLPSAFQDTVGAGDAVSAVWLLGTWLQWDYEQRLARGQELAAIICCQRGAIIENLDFYRQLQQKWQLLQRISANDASPP